MKVLADDDHPLPRHVAELDGGAALDSRTAEGQRAALLDDLKQLDLYSVPEAVPMRTSAKTTASRSTTMSLMKHRQADATYSICVVLSLTAEAYAIMKTAGVRWKMKRGGDDERMKMEYKSGKLQGRNYTRFRSTNIGRIVQSLPDVRRKPALQQGLNPQAEVGYHRRGNFTRRHRK